MKSLPTLIASLVLFTGSLLAVPTNMQFETDAPGNDTGSGLYYVRNSYSAVATYTGNITLTFTDTDTNWKTDFDASSSGDGTNLWILTFNDNATDPVNESDLANGFNQLDWQTEVASVADNGSDSYTLQIHVNGKGVHGQSMIIAYKTSAISPSQGNTMNFAWIDGNSPDVPVITAPIADSSQVNFVGYNAYTLTASANYSDVTSEFETATTIASGNTDTFRVDFYVTDDSSGSWDTDGSSLKVAESVLNSTTAANTVNFNDSPNRLSFVGAIAYDAAGNPTTSAVSSANLTETKWAQLARFKDGDATAWSGNSTVAGNWASTEYVIAGNAVDTVYFATDYYGNIDTSYSLGNIFYTESASSVPAAGFDGSDNIVAVGGDNVNVPAITSGNIEYSKDFTFYRQQEISLGADHLALWGVDSPVFQVRHSFVGNVIFYQGYDQTSMTSTGNVNDLDATGLGFDDIFTMGVNATLNNPATAGSNYLVKLALLDLYNNVCLYEPGVQGGGNTINISDNTTNYFENQSKITGYHPYGMNPLDHQASIPAGNIDMGSDLALSDGIVSIGNIMLYVAESGNLDVSTNFTSANTLKKLWHQSAALNVGAANDRYGYFDDNNTIEATGFPFLSPSTTTSTNNFVAGSNLALYIHVTDEYGNADGTAANVSTFTVSVSANNVNGTSSVATAYRNDESTFTGATTASFGVTNGVADWDGGATGIRFDKATTGTNTTYYPYPDLYLSYSTGGGVDVAIPSPELDVYTKGVTHVYFANYAGEPVSSANNLPDIVAGERVRVNAALTDLYGNVAIADTSANTVSAGNGILESGSAAMFNNSPNGTVADVTSAITQSFNTDGVAAGNLMYLIPVAKQGSMQFDIDAGAQLTAETSESFNVGANTVISLDYVYAGNGLYSSDNLLPNNTAGNLITAAVAGLDFYYNTNETFDANTIFMSVSLSTNVNTSLTNYAPSLAYSSNNGTNSGWGIFDINLFDADAEVAIHAATSQALTSSNTATTNEFAVASNVLVGGNLIVMLDATGMDNDDLTSSSTNVITSISSTIRDGSSASDVAVAGNAITVNAAVLDPYGNISSVSSDNIEFRPYQNVSNSPAGNVALMGNVLTTNGQGSVTATLYDAATSVTLGLQDVAGSGNTFSSTGWNSNNVTTAFTVRPGSITQARFATSAGNFVTDQYFHDGTTLVDGQPIANAGQSQPLTDVYIGFYDDEGNNMDSTSNTITGSVNVSVFSWGTSPTQVATPSIADVPLSIGVSGNLNTEYLVYFDPNDTEQSITISDQGEYSLFITQSTSMYASRSGNSNTFKVQDQTPPVVDVTYPNGGELLYSGQTWNVLWDASDSNLGGTGSANVEVSYDSGVTWESPAINSSVANDVEFASWSITGNVNTTKARIRVTVTDDAGNVGVDTSDSDFTISPSTSVISYVVGDIDSDTVVTHFREPVYNTSGVGLESGDFDMASGVPAPTGVSHSAGATSATLTLESALVSGNINTTEIGITSGEVSPLSTGASPYTATTALSSEAIRQLVAGTVSGNRSVMSASDNQNIMGLKLTGWTGMGNFNKINVRIDQVGGTVTASDFDSTAGIQLIDAASGNVVSDAPTIAVGETIEIELSDSGNTLGTTPLTAHNYYLSVKTSSTVSDVVPDSFNVTVESVEIYNTTTSANMVFSLYGSSTTQDVVIDVTAPSSPTVTVDSVINAAGDDAVTIDISGEAGARAYYDVAGFNASMSAYLNVSDNGILPAAGNLAFTVDLSSMADGTLTLTSWQVDEVMNNGNTQGFVTTKLITKDTTPIAQANVSITMSDVSSATEKAASVSIELTEAGETGADYSLVISDSAATQLTAITGSMSDLTSTATVSGIDVSSLTDGFLTASVTFTDDAGNSGTASTNTTDITKDTTAPVLGSVRSVNSLVGRIGAAQGETITLASATDAISTTASIVATVTDSIGSTDSVSATVNSGASFVWNLPSANLMALADGTISVSVVATDVLGNSSPAGTTTFTLDETAPAAPVQNSPTGGDVATAVPTLAWSAVSDATEYHVDFQNLSTTVSVNGLAGTSYTYQTTSTDNTLRPGTYTWSVVAEDEAGNQSASASTTFTVEKPDAPSLLSPINGDVAVAVPTLTWSSVAGANLYHVNFTNALGATISVNGLSSSNTTYTLMTDTGAGNVLTSGNYTWSVVTEDIYGNQSTWSAANAAYTVIVPDAPSLISPTGNASVPAMPTFAWTEVTTAANYTLVVTGPTNVTETDIEDNSVTIGTALTNGEYSWVVRTTDQYGNTSGDSDEGTFMVEIPVLQYVVGDVGSATALAVFDTPVFGDTNGTGVLDEEDFTAAALGGVSFVDHTAGAITAEINFGQTLTESSSDATGINSATVTPAAVYGVGGAQVAMTANTIRQLAAVDTAEAMVALTTTSTNMVGLKLTGWTGADVDLVAIDLKVIPVNGNVLGEHLTISLGNVSMDTVSTAALTGSIGETQTMTLTTPVDLSSTPTSAPNFYIMVQADETSTVFADSSEGVAKVIKLSVEGVTLSVDASNVDYMIVGEALSGETVLSDVSIDDANSTGTGNLEFTPGQTISLYLSGNIGAAATYVWTQTEGPSVLLDESVDGTVFFVPSEAGSYDFTVTYTVDGYSIVVPTTSGVTIRSAEDANLLDDLENGSFVVETAADLTQGFEAITLTDDVLGQEDKIIKGAETLLTALDDADLKADFDFTDELVDDLLTVLDQATANVDDVADGVEVLKNIDNLPAVSTDQVNQTFKILSNLTGSDTTDAQVDAADFTDAVDTLYSVAFESIAKSGQKSIEINLSGNVKATFERVIKTEVNSVSIDEGTGVLFTASISADTFAGLEALGINGAGGNLAVATARLVADALADGDIAAGIDGIDDTVAFASDIFDLSILTDGGDKLDFGANRLDEEDAIEVTLALDGTKTSGKTYIVLARDDEDADWSDDGVTTGAVGSTSVTFTTTHLTQFAIFQVDAPEVGNGGGGGGSGGCLLD